MGTHILNGQYTCDDQVTALAAFHNLLSLQRYAGLGSLRELLALADDIGRDEKLRRSL